jgi:hypothetical protein
MVYQFVDAINNVTIYYLPRKLHYYGVHLKMIMS